MPRSNPRNYIVDAETGCWIWQGSKTRGGYGYCKFAGEKKAHRVQYVLRHGAGSIPENLQLDHLCKNPSCVNPSHLEPVTPAENTRRSSSAKLQQSQVVEIRQRFASGEKQSDLSAQYGVTFRSISRIVRGYDWKDAGGPISLDNRLRMGTRRRLSDADVMGLRAMYASGESQKSLSIKFGISNQHVGRLISGKQRQIKEQHNVNADFASANAVDRAIGGASQAPLAF